MSDPFIGQIIQGGWNFAPRGYLICAGQLISIAQNSALFALLGTNFGGNGTTTFGIPDLQGRSMVGSGNGAGLSPATLGQKAGSESVTLLQSNLPAHSHSLNVANVKATVQAPVTGVAIGRATDTAPTPAAIPVIYVPAGNNPNVALNPASIGPTGNNTPVTILPPYQVVTMVMATQGIFPSRN
jgi:microcystin-dependent protein